jgi:hypothetical protein
MEMSLLSNIPPMKAIGGASISSFSWLRSFQSGVAEYGYHN